MSHTLTVLGSTGSIGTQTLEAAELLGLPIIALTANKNAKLLEAQARKFAPKAVALADKEAARDLKTRLADTSVQVLSGPEGVMACAAMEADIVESSLVGVAGLLPTLAAIRAGNRRVALANKETLVCAGHIVKRELAAHGCELIPVDSEHSAIFQCLRAGAKSEVKRILLTASGGPFRTLTQEELAAVTPALALRHPNWDMGAKVTVDSASMMNKGLEVIEAMHLFDVTPEQITVLVHPQSIVHSAVEFTDNAVIARTLGEIARMLADEEEITLYTQGSMLLVSCGGLTVVSRLYQGDFIKKENVIPTRFSTTVTLSKAMLTVSAERAAIINRGDKNNLVTLNIAGDEVRVTATSDNGNVNEVVPCTLEGVDLTISMNAKFLLDALRALDEDTVTVSFGGAISPFILQNAGDKHSLYLILPVRNVA